MVKTVTGESASGIHNHRTNNNKDKKCALTDYGLITALYKYLHCINFKFPQSDNCIADLFTNVHIKETVF